MTNSLRLKIALLLMTDTQRRKFEELVVLYEKKI